MKNNNQCESVMQSIQLVFFTNLCLFVCLSSTRQYSVAISAVNQNAPINKNSKSSNSKNLKQHTFAKSISLCCFCFCSVREIDRFIILICRYLSHRSKIKFSTRFSFSQFSHIFSVFVFAFFVFAFIFSRLSHLL